MTQQEYLYIQQRIFHIQGKIKETKFRKIIQNHPIFGEQLILPSEFNFWNGKRMLLGSFRGDEASIATIKYFSQKLNHQNNYLQH